jgi:hypothetical protein
MMIRADITASMDHWNLTGFGEAGHQPVVRYPNHNSRSINRTYTIGFYLRQSELKLGSRIGRRIAMGH